MPPKIDIRATLARMERACGETARQLDIIEHQTAARAERMVITFRTKVRQFGRGTSTWTPPDERLYREKLALLRFQRRAEIDALTRKLARQSAAIDAFRHRHRLNGPSSPIRGKWLSVDKTDISRHDKQPTGQEGDRAEGKTARNDQGGKRWSY